MHGRRELGYHANKPNASGEERYITPKAQVPMIAIFLEPANGGFDV
jgi:hypothetical protein